MSESLSNDNNTCVVCFKNVLYFSIGECDHPVCFECSTRMRVLCLTNECPICRKDLSRVVFTDTVLPYKELRTRVFPDRLFERQFKIGFCDEKIKEAYDHLLEHRCQLCPKNLPYRTFTMLNDHMRKAHEKYFCDLCVKHLKIFSNERKCYTRQELAHHRRKGDLDDTSHRGHPLCEFCEERFMDADELYRHLRKEHLYCHLCDADGRNLYYATHSALQQHFKTEHYLCEEGECATQYLTAVFRSEIDLKAHKATIHGRNMPRGAARQARTLELQFNITPHAVVSRGPQQRRSMSPVAAPAPAAADIDTRSVSQFPRLSAAPPAATLAPGPAAPSHLLRGTASLARTERNFPALDGSARAPAPGPAPAPVTATIVRNSKPSVSVQLHSQPASASNFRLTQPTGNRISIPQQQQQQRKQALSDDDFPSLGATPRDDHPSLGAGTTQPPKVAMINSQEMQALQKPQKQMQQRKQQLTSEAFPALSSTATPSAPPKWITVSKAKEKKQAKPEPPPQPKEATFNPVADFPTLPITKSKSKKKIGQPQQKPTIQLQERKVNQPPPPSENAKPSKKDKKKQNNNRKENIEEDLVEDLDDRRIMRDNYVSTVNNNSSDSDRKIKTVESSSALAGERNWNGGTGDFALAAKDYPPLSAKSANSLPEKKVDRKADRKPVNGTVPPGFQPRPACELTFTNSAGQSFPAPPHAYIAPPDFEARNRALVKQFAVALGGAAAVEDFKVASRAFRDNALSAAAFLQHCRAALGAQLDAVFAELVALLPDIGKQQELVLGREEPALRVCAVCGQLLAAADAAAHHAQHWPPLAKGAH